MPATMPAMDFISEVWSLLAAARLELLTFFAAMAMYAILNMYRPKTRQKKCELKATCAEEPDRIINRHPKPVTCKLSFNSAADVELSLQAAIHSEDHSAVLQCWDAAKQFDIPATLANLPRVVGSMQCCKKDVGFIVCELRKVFNKYPDSCTMSLMNDVLEPVSRRFDTQLMDCILQELPSFGLTKDAKTYEILLDAQFSMRNFDRVETLKNEMTENETPFTARALVVITKAALRTNNVDEAICNFHKLKSTWSRKSDVSEKSSQAPCHIVSRWSSWLVKSISCSDFYLS
jgi:hypothetical protein